MTELNNSNGEDTSPNSTPKDGPSDANSGVDGSKDAGAANADELWAEFESSHADDLGDVAHSRSAKQFEKHAKRKEKKALLSINDLDEGSFADDMPRASRGPRDFTASSWLDADDTLDAQDDFVPPNPKIGHIDATTLMFWGLLLVGIAGTIASVFFHQYTGILGMFFGPCALIGGAGLIARHRGSAQTRDDYFDDGARV